MSRFKVGEFANGAPIFSVAYQRDFIAKPRQIHLQYGVTLAEIVQLIRKEDPAALPDDFEGKWEDDGKGPIWRDGRGVITINGHRIYSKQWARVRPRYNPNAPTIICLWMTPRGGGGRSSTKSIIALVAAVALSIATAGIAAAGMPALGAAFAAGSIGAKILAAAVGIAGAMAISALISPPVQKSTPNEQAKGDASASGNILQPGGAISRVCGTVKIFPTMVQEPYVERVDDDEWVYTLFALAGPHRLQDIRIDGTPIDQMEGVEFEVREGWDTDLPITLIPKQARTKELRLQLSEHKLSMNSSTPTRIRDQVNPETCLPIFHGWQTRLGWDRHDIHIDWPEGVYDRDSAGDDVVVSLRLRMKRSVDTQWVQFPEMMVSNNRMGQMRSTIELWRQPFVGEPNTNALPDRGGFVAVYGTTLAQDSVQPVTTAWIAHPYFGGTYWTPAGDSGTFNNTVAADPFVCRFYLDPEEFPDDYYDLQMKRSFAFKRDAYAFTSYTLDGVVFDLFGYYVSSSIDVVRRQQNDLAKTAILVRSVNQWFEHPVGKPGMALIAIKAKNIAVQNVSVLASGYVQDWDGEGWNEWKVTDNPAPHLRYVLRGGETPLKCPAEIVDDDTLVEWRAECADRVYRVNALFEDMSSLEVRTIIASCGFARPYQSDLYGVAMDRNFTDDQPLAQYSQVNAWDVRTETAWPNRPSSFRVTFADEALNYEDNEIIVPSPLGGGNGASEAVYYKGLTSLDEATSRARYDQASAVLRGTFFYFTTNDGMRLRKGSLISLAHPILLEHTGGARVVTKIMDGGSPERIGGFKLNNKVDIVDEPDIWTAPDFWSIPDLWSSGFESAMAIARTDGTISVHKLLGPTGFTDEIYLQTPIDDAYWTAPTVHGGDDWPLIEDADDVQDAGGSELVVGLWGMETVRLLVTSMTFDQALNANVTCVAEAPELNQYRGIHEDEGGGDPDPEPGGDPSSAELIRTVVSSGPTIQVPNDGTVAAGDFAVLMSASHYTSGNTAPVETLIPGWTDVRNAGFSTTGGPSIRSHIDAKILTGADLGSVLTGMDGDVDSKVLLFYRADVPFTAFTVVTGVSDPDAGTVPAATMTFDAGDKLRIVVGGAGGTSTGVTGSGTLATNGDMLNGATTRHRVYHEIIPGTPPATRTFGQSDAGNNAMVAALFSFP